MRTAVLGFVAGLTTLAWVGGVSAAAPVDLFNDGSRTESVHVGDVEVHDLKRGTLYTASTFPLKLTARPPDALWLGGQTQAGKFRFVVFQHKYPRNAQGKVSLWGSGEVAVETGTGKTGSVAQVLKNLRSTPQISVTAPDERARRGICRTAVRCDRHWSRAGRARRSVRPLLRRSATRRRSHVRPEG